MISKEEIILHDYFDNLLSPSDQRKFEDTLIDNIDLAIELGKLKNLHRNLRNLTSNFEPDSIVIDNIIESLLEGKKNTSPNEVEAEKKSKKKEKKKKKKTKKVRKGLKAKTKYRLNQLFTLLLVLMILASAIAGYQYFQKENTTFPWTIENIEGDPSNNIQSFIVSGIKKSDNLVTKKSQKVKLTIPSKAILEIEDNSNITIQSGTRSYNSILFASGKMNFIPLIGNEIFDIFVNDITLQSKNTEFNISSLEGKLSEVIVKSNFLTVLLRGKRVKVPFNHYFQIYNSSEISVPISININKSFAKLLEKYSLTRNEDLVPQILKVASRYNAFSLHFLLSDVSPMRREQIILKLEKFFSLPSKTSLEKMLILDEDALNAWWDKIYREM